MTKKQVDRILLLAYLKKLRRNDLTLYVIVLIFMLLQLAVTFIKVEATPFFLYGMYSEKLPVRDMFSRISLQVNGKTLESYRLPLRERQLLQTNAENYEEMKGNQHTDPLQTRVEGYEFISRSPLYPFFKKRIYNTPETEENFRNWLRKKALVISGNEAGRVQITRTVYRLDQKTMRLNPIQNEILEDL